MARTIVRILLIGLSCNLGMGALIFPEQFRMTEEEIQKTPWTIQDRRFYNYVRPSLQDVEQATNLLKAILMENWEEGGSPIVYIEEDPQSPYEQSLNENEDRNKRARYYNYRRYPWKRQNNRNTYDPHNPYICSPSKQDVFRLLVELHGAQDGIRDRPVSFCNRKRPAHAIFNHIRFLGKKK